MNENDIIKKALNAPDANEEKETIESIGMSCDLQNWVNKDTYIKMLKNILVLFKILK